MTFVFEKHRIIRFIFWMLIIGLGLTVYLHNIREEWPANPLLTGRGNPWKRGVVTGLMTMTGGLGHTLPYLIPNFTIATAIAAAIVVVELWAIAWIRARYMDTPFLRAVFEVVVGGLIVFAVGIGIGNLAPGAAG